MSGPCPTARHLLTQLTIDIAEDDIEKIGCGRDGLANNKACVHTQPRLHTAGATGSIPVPPTITFPNRIRSVSLANCVIEMARTIR